MDDVIKLVRTRFETCASKLVSSDYGKGYLEALEHLENEINPEEYYEAYVLVKVNFKSTSSNTAETLERIENEMGEVLLEFFPDSIANVEANYESAKLLA